MKPPDYRKLFEAAAGLYVVFDRELRIVAASDGYLQATRKERAAVVGRLLFEAFPENPGAEESAHAIARAMYGRVFAGGGPEAIGVKRYDLPLPGGGFEERYWSAVTTPILGDGGEVEYALSHIEDVTDVVRLRKTGEAARATDLRKDEFLATLAHELRNPLAPIRNALAILRLKAPQDPDLLMAREMLDRQVAHLVRLVDDLLDVSRITFGKVGLRREPLDLRGVAEEAVAASMPMLDEAGHRLTVRLGPEPLWVDGDRVRLAQAVVNLLANAARYTRRGGEILLAMDRDGGEARLCVSDNGMGIAPDMLEGIFEAFTQGGVPGAGGGIGIGLSLSRKLVELHGGTIVAESEGPDRGSRFTVRLPLVAGAGDGAQQAAPPAGVTRRHRFLVVDDNADAARSQAKLLRMLGHDAEVANDGEDALRKAARYRPEIVLLDIGMPGMDGFEVARRLRAMPEAREATLIAQTGFGQPEDRLRSEAAGFDAHLAKPAEVSAILEAAARARAAPRAAPG